MSQFFEKKSQVIRMHNKKVAEQMTSRWKRSVVDREEPVEKPIEPGHKVTHKIVKIHLIRHNSKNIHAGAAKLHTSKD